MSEYKEINKLVSSAKHILILQADNPDGDSLGSSLALEAIFLEMGKSATMICAVNMPAHLKYLSGWDRVVKDIPTNFDITLIVDTSTETLFENTSGNRGFEWIKAKPVIVLDHHIDSKGISFADIIINEPLSATGELIYKIASDLKWPLPLDALEMLAISIMSDSLGLTTQSASPETFRTMADLVEKGVNIAKLDNARRQLMQKNPVLIPYKGRLLQRIQFGLEGKIASIIIPWGEIQEFSPLYNPTMLVIDDMRMTEGVVLAIGYKVYADGKITAKIRANYGFPIAGKLATEFGGGGHEYAAGFKILKTRPITELHSQVIKKTNQLLEILKTESTS